MKTYNDPSRYAKWMELVDASAQAHRFLCEQCERFGDGSPEANSARTNRYWADRRLMEFQRSMSAHADI